MKFNQALKYIFIVIIMYISIASVSAKDDECKNEVISLLKNFEDSFSNKDYVSISYSYKIEMWDSTLNPPNSKIEYSADKNKSIFITDDMEVYQDTSVSYTVVNKRQEILITDNHQKNQNFGPFRLDDMIDYLRKYGGVDSCATVDDRNANYDKLIVILISDSVPNTFAGVKIKYFISTKKNAIVTVESDFPPQYRTKSVLLEYHDNDSKEMKRMLNNDITSFIYDSQTKRKAKYQKYNVIDQRSTKK